MKTLDTIDLAAVTGGQGFVSPCLRYQRMPASQMTGLDVAIGQRFGCVAKPTRSDLRLARHIEF